jgi:hypothetical protein
MWMIQIYNKYTVEPDFLKIVGPVGPRGQNFIGSGISVVLVGPTVRLMFQFHVGWMFTSRLETWSQNKFWNGCGFIIYWYNIM